MLVCMHQLIECFIFHSLGSNIILFHLPFYQLSNIRFRFGIRYMDMFFCTGIAVALVVTSFNTFGDEE